MVEWSNGCLSSREVLGGWKSSETIPKSGCLVNGRSATRLLRNGVMRGDKWGNNMKMLPHLMTKVLHKRIYGSTAAG